jgi:hypothetical protein
VQEGHISTTLLHLGNVAYRVGRTLNFDPVKEEVIGGAEDNRLLHGTYRAPYVVPEQA